MVGSRAVVVCFVLSVIAGCATLPEYRDEPITTADVVRHVRCELRDALRSSGNEWLTANKWNVKLSFTFDLQQSGEISTGDNGWTFPLNQGATFVASFTAGLTGTGNRTENIEFDQNLPFLKDDQTLPCPKEDLGRFDQLGGYLGIADLLERGSLSRDLTPTQATSISKLAYTVEFIVKKNANLNPKFNMIPIGKEKLFSGSAKWMGSFSDTQKLILTFTPPADKPEAPCPVSSDVAGGWPTDKCPAPVYVVEVKRPCVALAEDKCKRRNDCRWNTTPAPGACASTIPPTMAAAPFSRVAPFGAARRAPAGPGVGQADKQILDSGYGNSVLNNINTQLQRQGISN